jgi:hypothetical protein
LSNTFDSAKRSGQHQRVVDGAAQAGVEVKVLLLGPKGITTAEMVGVINEVTGRSVTLERISTEDYARRVVAGDEGGKDEGFFRSRLV